MFCCRHVYYRYINTLDMHKMLLWVVLCAPLNITSHCTADHPGLFWVCSMQSRTLLQVRLDSFISRRWKIGCFRGKSRLAFILWQWHFVSILSSVIQSCGFFSEKLNLLHADGSQLQTGSCFWAQPQCTHKLAKASVGTQTQIYFWRKDHILTVHKQNI